MNMHMGMTMGITRTPTTRCRLVRTIIVTAICRCGILIRMCPTSITGTVTDGGVRVQ